MFWSFFDILWSLFAYCRELDGHLGALGADLGSLWGWSGGPGLDFRWILGFRVVPIGTPNPSILGLFFDMVAQQCQRHCGHPFGMHLGPVLDP